MLEKIDKKILKSAESKLMQNKWRIAIKFKRKLKNDKIKQKTF